MDNKFPILGSNPKEYIKSDLIKPHENQALINHSQTLKRLAERGGLSWAEMLYILRDEPFNYRIQLSETDARTKVLEIINLYK